MLKKSTKSKKQTCPKKSQVKTKKTKSNTFEFGVFDLVTPPNVVEPLDLDRINTKFIPFGKDNLFPQYLSELKRKSSTHRSVLAQKVVFTAGAKFVCKDDATRDFIKDVNADGESLRDVFKKLADDYYTFGNAYIEGVLYDGGINLYHLDATTVRMSKNKRDVYVHPDWKHWRSREDEIQKIALYPRVTSSRFVMQFKDYEPTFRFYGLPDYVAGLEHISVDYEIGLWNNTQFQNGFQPSAIVEINGDMGEEEARKLVQEAQKKFCGQGNNGKIMFIVKNGDTANANVQILKDDRDGSWMELQQITDQNIITAHRWQPSLSGIVSSGKMNNTGSEIRISYDLVMTTVIKETSDLLLTGIHKLLYHEMGFDPKNLKIHYEPPVSYANDVDIKQVLTINEQRALLDEDFDMLEDGDMFVADREVIVVEKDDDGDGELDERKEITVEQ